MLLTYKFRNVYVRNDFVNIVKELWFKVSINSYEQNLWSKSTVKENVFGWANIDTTNDVIVIYEVNVEKDVTNEEIRKVNKLANLLSFSDENLFFWKVSETLWLWFLFWFLSLYAFIKIVTTLSLEKFFNTEPEMFFPFFVLSLIIIFFNRIVKRKKKRVEMRRIKGELLKSELWQFWINTVKRINI